MDAAQSGDASPFVLAEGILSEFTSESFHPLLTGASWQQMVAIARQVRTPTHTVCLECRLGAGVQQADFAFALFPFHAALAAETFGGLDSNQDCWRRLCDFLADWGSPGSALSVKIPFVCVAFDMPEGTSSLPAPCLSFCIDPDFFARRLGLLVAEAQQDRADLVELSARCYSMITATSPSEATLVRLRTCVGAGSYVQVKHVSFMLSRAESPLKLNVRIPRERLADFIVATMGRADATAIEREVSAYVPWAKHVQLNLLIHPATHTPLEVEVFPAEATAAERAELIERIVSTELCTVGQAAALRKVWNEPLHRTMSGRTIATAAYLKLRLTDARVDSVKAYLGLIPRILGAGFAARAS
jgi:hypothetical protein